MMKLSTLILPLGIALSISSKGAGGANESLKIPIIDLQTSDTNQATIEIDVKSATKKSAIITLGNDKKIKVTRDDNGNIQVSDGSKSVSINFDEDKKIKEIKDDNDSIQISDEPNTLSIPQLKEALPNSKVAWSVLAYLAVKITSTYLLGGFAIPFHLGGVGQMAQGRSTRAVTIASAFIISGLFFLHFFQGPPSLHKDAEGSLYMAQAALYICEFFDLVVNTYDERNEGTRDTQRITN